MAGAADNLSQSLSMLREYAGRMIRTDFNSIYQNSLNQGGAGASSAASDRRRYSVSSPGDAGVQLPETKQENDGDFGTSFKA